MKQVVETKATIDVNIYNFFFSSQFSRLVLNALSKEWIPTKIKNSILVPLLCLSLSSCNFMVNAQPMLPTITPIVNSTIPQSETIQHPTSQTANTRWTSGISVDQLCKTLVDPNSKAFDIMRIIPKDGTGWVCQGDTSPVPVTRNNLDDACKDINDNPNAFAIGEVGQGTDKWQCYVIDTGNHN